MTGDRQSETAFVHHQDYSSHGALNERLNTNYVNVSSEDNPVVASAVLKITGCIGACLSPRLILVMMRLLKAITFCFLGLTIAADLMYICLVELIVGNKVRENLGGWRDM
eukprot:2550272-Ditylum_brightwellii.AAC.1